MEIKLAIKQIYPALTDKDYIVCDDNNGKGPYILWYNKEIEQPTEEQLKVAWEEVKKIQQDEIDKKTKKEAIEKIATLSDQLNLAAGTIDIIVDTIAKDYPEILEHPWIIESKEKLNNIKAILYNE